MWLIVGQLPIKAGQKATNNKQKVTSNEQKVTNNEHNPFEKGDLFRYWNIENYEKSYDIGLMGFSSEIYFFLRGSVFPFCLLLISPFKLAH